MFVCVRFVQSQRACLSGCDANDYVVVSSDLFVSRLWKRPELSPQRRSQKRVDLHKQNDL